MTSENMAVKKPPSANRSHAAWAAGAVALVLAAGGGWLLTRPVAPTALAAGNPTARKMERPSTEAKAEPAAMPPSAESPLGRPPMVTLHPLPEIDLRKVQLALEGSGSPADAREAAHMLSICQGANAAAEMAYNLRDQGDTTWRQLEKRTGVSSESFIAASQDTVRRCQVFDAATLARRGELLKRADEGGAKDAALDYLIGLRTEDKQAADPELLGKLQRDARRSAEDGNFEALVAFTQTFDPALGVTLVEQQAYKEARFRIETEMSGRAVAIASRDAMENFQKTMSQSVPAPRALSPEEQREADALTERVVAAWRMRQGSGG